MKYSSRVVRSTAQGGALLLAVGAVSGAAQNALADRLVIDPTVSIQAAPGGYTTYTYTLVLEKNSALYKPLSPGSDSWAPDFIEIFDFAGLHAGPTFTPNAASGLTTSDFKLSAVADDSAIAAVPGFGGASAQDDSYFLNLKAEFDRSTALVNYSGDSLVLGTITAVSQYAANVQDTYISTDTTMLGNSDFNVGNIAVPLGPAATAPLPTVLLGGLGLLGLTRVRRSTKA